MRTFFKITFIEYRIIEIMKYNRPGYSTGQSVTKNSIKTSKAMYL